MINIKKAKLAFEEYMEHYNLEDNNIKRKKEHTYGVVRFCRYIATELGLDEENIKLAELIGILHDIGRFDQASIKNTFIDAESFDHAEYGIKILFEENRIRNFLEDTKYDNIIYKAILNHNKYKIEEGLSEIELLHCKIIRDADKLDNFAIKETKYFKNIFNNKYNSVTIEYDTISPKIYADFMEQKCIKLEDRKTQLDFLICMLAFIFDLNFDISLKYIKDNNYIDKLINKIEYKNQETKEKMQEIKKCARKYLDEAK